MRPQFLLYGASGLSKVELASLDNARESPLWGPGFYAILALSPNKIPPFSSQHTKRNPLHHLINALEFTEHLNIPRKESATRSSPNIAIRTCDPRKKFPI